MSLVPGEARISGIDLGVFVSRDPFMPTPGVVVYNPVYGLIDEDMPDEAQTNSLNFNPLKTTLPYGTTREVRVNDEPVWRNIHLFPQEELDCTPGPTERCYGFGNVDIDFRSDVDWVGAVIDRALEAGVGLVRGDSLDKVVSIAGRRMAEGIDPEWDKTYQVSIAFHGEKSERSLRQLERMAMRGGAYLKDETIPPDPHAHYLFKRVTQALEFSAKVYRSRFRGSLQMLKVQYDVETRSVHPVEFTSVDYHEAMRAIPKLQGGGISQLVPKPKEIGPSTFFLAGLEVLKRTAM